jgi:membrane-bound serine protease (ClpP class)
MTFVDTALFPNLVYLVLLAGVWLVALSMVAPGTGMIELAAFLALLLAGLGAFQLDLNAWSLAVLVVGAVFFGLSVWRRHEAVWLALSASALSIGSAFLFRAPDGGPAVNPLLAIVASGLTLGYFWLAVRKWLAAARAKPSHDPSAVMGQTGEARTALEPTGSVYVGGELWTARADRPLPAGTAVRVIDRDGLMLTVEAVEQSS